ncbi:MAG: hypothetical protein OEM41_06255 [Ignavibacteria bacterium]|nr:hypothetical protein [Ignavibacteria bacterium]
MDAQHNAPVQSLARYGLPFVVLVFYVTASLSFEYTPDSTFLNLQYVRGDLGSSFGSAGTPAPLWLGLVKAGSFSGLDMLLVAKVFSLVFGCTVVIASFLLGAEVTANRLLGLMAALATAMTVWLVREAPSGGAMPLVMALTLMTLFFLQRNEYLLAAVLAGLCLLLFWQAAGLAALVIADVMLNSIHKRRAMKLAASLALIIAGILLPWFLVAGYLGLDPLPLLPVDRAGTVTMDVFAVLAVAALLCLATAGFLKPGREGGTVATELVLNVTPVLWTVSMSLVGVLMSLEFLLIVLPVATIYAFRAVNIFFHSSVGEKGVYQLSVILGAIIILFNQASFAFSTRQEMDRTIDAVKPLMEIGAWLSLHAANDAVIVSDRRGTVGYYVQRPVHSPEEIRLADVDYLVARAATRDDFIRTYTPEHVGGMTDVQENQPYAVWKRGSSR